MASEHLRKRLEQLSDEELIDILRRHDTGEWQEVVFSTAAEVLRSRGMKPPQGQAAACGTELANAEPKLVPVANFATVVEAEACRSALLAAGFSVVGEDQFLLGVDPALGPALGGFRLAVPSEEADDVRAFLAAADGGELGGGLLVCDACGSADVATERTQSRGGTFLNTLLVGPVIPDVAVSFRCQSCGTTWA